MVKCQDLKDSDMVRRVNFANHVLNNMTQRDLMNTAFSDEATFTLDWSVNSQNVRRYCPKKTRGVDEGGRPENFRHTTNKYPKKVIDGAEYYNLLRYKAKEDKWWVLGGYVVATGRS